MAGSEGEPGGQAEVRPGGVIDQPREELWVLEFQCHEEDKCADKVGSSIQHTGHMGPWVGRGS